MTYENFITQLQIRFFEEAYCYIKEVENCIPELKNNPSNDLIPQRIFQMIHLIRKCTENNDLNELNSFLQLFEYLIIKIRNKEIQINFESISVIFFCNNTIIKALEDLRNDKNTILDTTKARTKINNLLGNNSYEEMHFENDGG